jgi:hypothetical protein
MAVQKAQADVLINRLHYALDPAGTAGAEERPRERRDAQEGFYEGALPCSLRAAGLNLESEEKKGQ